MIHLYDIPSHQLLRTISTHKGCSINFLASMLRPPDLIGHISLNLGVSGAADAKDTIPVKHVSAFQRMRDPKSREAHELPMLLPKENDVCTSVNAVTPFGVDRFMLYPQMYKDEMSSYALEELQRDHAFFLQSSTYPSAPGLGDMSLQSKVANLEVEVERLKKQLGKAKSVNDIMWDTIVQRAAGQGEVTEDSEKEHTRKRGRT